MANTFPYRLALAAVACATLCACDTILSSSPDWTADLGEVPAAASTSPDSLNHTPMAIVGTIDGLWRRALDGSGTWEQLGLQGVRIFVLRQDLTTTGTLFAAGEPQDDPEAAPFYRSDDDGETWTPATSWPLNPGDDTTEPFFDLAIAPDDPDRLYANLSGQSIAVLISEDDGAERSLRLFILDTNGDPFN